MSRLSHIWMIAMVALVASAAWGQDSSAPPPDNSAPPQDNSAQQPVPAYGQDKSTPPISENPPITGLDQPGLEPHGAPLSYIQPGATVSESWDSNIANTTGGSTGRSISRGFGSLTLQRLWSHYDLALQYGGGVAYYQEKGVGWKLMQQMDVDQKITWKRGQLSLRDSFSYLPEGNFGAAYGSLGSQGITSVGDTAFSSFWGGAAFGTLGLVPRILNLALVDVEQNLTPKSAVTAAGGYAISHFYGSDPSTGVSFFNDTQISAQVGYNRIVTPHTQIAVMYGYQGFDFSSTGAKFHSHIVQGIVGHRISGRMDFILGAGPQITNIDLPNFICSNPLFPPNAFCSIGGGTLIPITTHDRRIGVAGQVKFRYHFPRTVLSLSYERYETGGSGFFAGAQTDLARLRAERPVSRTWTAFTDVGFARNSRLASLTPAQEANCVFAGQQNPNNLPLCPGVNAQTYEYGFIGAGVHHAFSHDFHGFASYEFNELSFDNSYCAGLPTCSRIGHRHVISIGLDWTPRPIRID